MKKLLTSTALFLCVLSYAQIPTASLLGYYPFNGNANDASGNAQHGTVTGATLTADRFGNANSAYNFNGTSNYIALPAGTFTTLNLYTYSCWIKQTVAAPAFIMCFGESSYGYCQTIVTQTTGAMTASSYNSGGGPLQSYIISTSTYPLSQWIHVAMTRDLTTLKLYVNGVLFTSSTAPTVGQNANYGSNQPIRATIGVRSTFVATSYFSGSIDDVRIYGSVLSQSDILALYNENCFQNTSNSNFISCSGNSATISAAPAPSNTVNWYSSLTSSTSIGTGSLLATSVLSSGLYTYYAEASTCSLITTRLPITVSVSPTPTISVSNGTICSGNSYTISPSGAASYSFSSGNPVAPGVTSNYTVIGASSSGCVSNIQSLTVTVNTTPTVSVNSGFVCNGQSFTLNPSGASTYSYTGGSAIVTPTANTSYIITGSTGNGCYGSTVSNVGVVAPPTLLVTGNGNVCVGSSATLSVSGANFYTWSTGSNSSSITVTPTVTTSYTVSGVNLFGCLSSTVTTVNINPLPIVSVNDGTICSGSSFTISPSGASTYAISGGSAVVSPTVNSTYFVVGTSAQGCLSSNVAISNVSVLSVPVISVNSGSICSGNSFTLNPGGGISYTFSGGSSVISPTVSATYTVTGTGPNGCSNNAFATVTVINLPAITISGPNSICIGDNATLTASGASSYTWNTGSNAASISISPGSTSTYSVVGNNTSGCDNINIKTVIVNSLPLISVNSGTICSGTSFTLLPGGASTYTYSSGTNIVSPGTNSSYSVTGTSAQGCISSNVAVSNVSVSASPVISVNSGSICSGNSFTMTPGGGITYSYSSASAIVSPISNTNYTVTGFNSIGCSSQGIATVIVNALPVVSINSPTSICSGNSAALIANGANSYTWNTGLFTQSITVSPLSSTSYSVVGMTVNGCTANANVFLTINSLPIIGVNSGSVCLGNTFTLVTGGAATYSYSGGSNLVTPSVNTSYSVSGTSAQGCVSSGVAVANITVVALPLISVNSGTVCSGNIFTLLPSGAISYSFSSGSNTVNPTSNTSYTVTGINAQGCISAPVIANVNVSAVPLVTVNSGSICAGSAFTINPSGANTYTISGGSGIVSPITTTSYSVTGTNIAGCVSSAVISTVTVNALPIVSVNNASVCLGTTYTLLPSGAATYTFSSGSALVTPSVNTTYSITGTSSFGCVSSSPAICYVTVLALPNITISGNSTVCSGSSLSYTASGASTYTWNLSSIGSIISVTPTSNTTYTVIGTNANGCVNSTTKAVTLISSPTITANSGSICIGSSFVINPSGASTYSFSGNSATVSPVTTTNYFITGYSSAGCVSSNIATISVVVNPLPVLSISGSTAVCDGNSITLTASGASNYTWSTFSTGSTVLLTPSASANYSVNGTGLNGCSNTASFQIVVYSLPTITLNSGAICPGNSFTFTPSGAVSYTYSSGSSIVSPTATGNYSVFGSSSDGCVSALPAIVTVSVVNTLSVSVIGNMSICEGDTAYLTANGASTYFWSSGPITNTIALNPITTNSYSVTGVSGTCSNTAVFSVSVFPVPVISVNNGTICSGSTFTLTPSGASNYTYSSGSPLVSPVVTSSYTITGDNTFGCATQTNVIIYVNQLPTITVVSSSSNSICAGEEVSLVTSGAVNYTWNPAVTDTSSPIVISPTISTTYTILGIDQNGCIGMTTINQVVDACTGIAEFNQPTSFNIYPNPNTGSFSIRYDLNSAASFELRIEDLQGKLIKSYALNSFEKTYQISESKLIPGVYFCKIVSNGVSLATRKIIVTN